MKRLVHAFAAVALALLWRNPAEATGFYGPVQYLQEGGKSVAASPEFYWELEVKRLARDFDPPEKLLKAPAADENEDEEPPRNRRLDMTADADLEDFAAALGEKTIQPPEAEEATTQHKAARDALNSLAAGGDAALPAEFASEFADYHRGAFAFRRGEQQWEDARQTWLALLARPAHERRYRSVWAAFMLGKLALKKQDPEAALWFQRTRELAAQGFKDSLGMAADSYGWEARGEWKLGRPEKAAPLFLTQLALGDTTAVISLKALIPDREAVGGFLNYGPEPDEREAWTEEQKRAAAEQAQARLNAAARDPLLRRLVTAHILATCSSSNYFEEERAAGVERAKRWLAVIDAANLGSVDDAEYLGWAAYNAGNYREAARWLRLAKNETPAGLWLKAKLQRRDGKLADAAQSMMQAWRSLHDPRQYTGWSPSASEPAFESPLWSESPKWSFPQSASGDLGSLHLARADFIAALDAFFKGDLWTDAAFVAERVLSADELKKYVDQLPAPVSATPAPRREDEPEPKADPVTSLRYLLGRRLVREDRAAEAMQYLPPPNDRLLRAYADALKRGADDKLPKAARAEAFFQAAWLARYNGMEMMGAEGAPDVFEFDGNFEMEDLAAERLKGSYVKVEYDPASEAEKKTTLPVVLKSTAQERARLSRHKINPNVRWHYRLVAGALAMKAAQLLPDNTEELADVINTAGHWVKNEHKPTAERYYNALERRGAQTEIGREARAKRWFATDAAGPWSSKQKESHGRLQAELGIAVPEE